MNLRRLSSIVTLLGFSTLIALVPGLLAMGQESSQPTPCVLVELFTSEGCSSCPPADKVLSNLQNQQPIPGVHIITLGEHVSYWNYLGWQDPFSSDLFTERQHSYAGVFRASSVYTPQMIVDGHSEFVGNDYSKAISTIREAAKTSKAAIVVDVRSASNDNLIIKGGIKWLSVNEAHAAALVAVLVEDNLHSSVSRGENSGRVLNHSSVARELIDGNNSLQASGAFEIAAAIKPSWKRQNLRVVVFAQNPATGDILGAAESKLSN